MLPKQQRLTKKEFANAFRNGKRHRSPAIEVRVSSNPTFHGAVVVGKKVYARAVDRTKLRRQLYAALARYAQKAHPATYIVIVYQPIKDIPHQKRAELLQKLLQETL